METVPHVMPSEPDVKDSASPSVADNTSKYGVYSCCSIYRNHLVLVRGTCSYKLSELANLRSGDKGDTANIGVCVYVCSMYSRWL